MRRQRGYLYGGLGVAMAMMSMVAALEAQVATARSGSGVDRGTVNRALKGDRLPLIPGATGAAPIELRLAPEPKLPDGCEDPRASRSPFSAEVAGRCLAAAPTDHQLVSIG